jgi:peptidoglycan hydrolase FlgJ
MATPPLLFAKSSMPALASNTGMAALGALKTSGGAAAPDAKAKARGQATDFEAMFLNAMFGQMFTGINGDGPFGGDGATGVWRSFLTDEYSKSFAKAGGIGIADHVYRSLLAQQEQRAS